MPEYKTLEPTSLKALGLDTVPSFSGSLAPEGFLSVSTFLYTLFFVAIIVAAFYRYVVAGALRMQASESTIRQSNEIIKRVTLGLLGVFSLFILLFTVNKNMVTGDVDLRALTVTNSAKNTSALTVITSTPTSNTSSPSCENKDLVISKIQSGNVCGGAVCTVLTGCNWKQYEASINRAVGNNTDLKKMVIVTMCKESGARLTAQNKNPNQTYDCGLMQINQSGACTQASYDAESNIAKGVALLRQKISAAGRTYPGVPAVAGVFSAYNCCGNGDNPNAQSVDCSTGSGFPNAVPKWACPINPGTSSSNMCSVKKYACELTACLDRL